MRTSDFVGQSLVIALIVLLMTINLSAVPSTMSYQAVLSDSNGNPVIDNDYTLHFVIYNAETAGDSLWGEIQLVTTKNGRFHVKLGGINPLPDSVFDQSPIFLGTTVGADPELSPRTPLQSVPYAVKSKESEVALLSKDSEKLGGIGVDELPKKDSINSYSESNAFYGTTHFLGIMNLYSKPLNIYRNSIRWDITEGADYGLRFTQDYDDSNIDRNRTVLELTDSGTVDVASTLRVHGKVKIGGDTSGYELPLFYGSPGDVLTSAGPGITTWAPLPGGGGSSWNWSDSSSFGPDSVTFAAKSDSAAIAQNSLQLGGLDVSEFPKRDSVNDFNHVNSFNSTTHFHGSLVIHDSRVSINRAGKPRWHLEESFNTGLTIRQYYDDSDVSQYRFLWELTDSGDVEVYGKATFGYSNINSGDKSFIGGGGDNQITSHGSVIAGGYDNTVDTYQSTIGGGYNNTITRAGCAIAGGYNNSVESPLSSIGGGADNTIATSADYARISGGQNNSILSGGGVGFIGGGLSNTVSGGGAGVAGGSYNSATGYAATIGGGERNSASGIASAVVGGYRDTASGDYSFIGGGEENTISPTGTHGFIGGGSGNRLSGNTAGIGGGTFNSATGDYSAVFGGYGDTAAGDYSFAGGGYNNSADEPYASVAGGYSNSAGGDYSFVGGGYNNLADASYSIIPGGRNCRAAGLYSFAAGYHAKALHNLSFVWAGGGEGDVSSSAAGEFTVVAYGGVRFFSSGSMTSGVTLAPGSGSWSSVSDRSVKRNIKPVDGEEILQKISELEISRWNYEAQDESIQHIGPMAQDFYRLFEVGDNNTTISTVDPDGISLAAIKALYEQNKELFQENDQLKELIEQLQERLTILENDE